MVCTGSEPLLQLDESLVQAFHSCDIEVAVETNGTRLPPAGVDWICVSPKIGTELVLRSDNKLKLESTLVPHEWAENLISAQNAATILSVAA